MKATLWMLALLGLGACQVTPAAFAGKACNPTHPCADGRQCVDFVCTELNVDGGANACVRWRQASDGFASFQACSGCSSVPAEQNQLTSSILNSANDFAYGEVDAQHLFSAKEGRIHGSFQAPLSARVDNRTTFLLLSTNAGTLLNLYFMPNWELGAETSAGVLQPSAVDPQPSSANRFPPTGVDYVFDVSWELGTVRRVLVNGEQVYGNTLVPGAVDPGNITSARLGIISYDGSESAGWSNTLSDWVFCDTANGQL